MVLRLTNLAQRPMHTDESVHAIKFGSLLEKNDYKYDPYEYHGPTLNYFTLIPAWLSSAKKLTDISELHLRVVPAAFGLVLILGYLLLLPELGREKVLVATLLTAISPAFVFYSRYYIQEMLFVSFSFLLLAALYRFIHQPRYLWALLTGIALGLVFSTKETSVITFAGITVSLFVLCFTRRISFDLRSGSNRLKIGVAVAAAVFISILFYSSFFTHPRGIVDSILTFKTYIDRGRGEQQAHLYPWYYYLKWLAFNKMDGKPLWSELFPLLFAGWGLVSLFAGKRNKQSGPLLQFLAVAALFLFAVYSIIPYKTPWSMLSWYQLFLIFAAVQVVDLMTMTKKLGRLLVITIVVAGSIHLLYQSVLANSKYSADISNPYVYAHTSPDIFNVKAKIDAVSSFHPDGKKMYIEVISPGADYWPLPWYLREYPNVAYWSEVNKKTPLAQLIIAKPDVESQLMEKMFELPPPGERCMYLPLFDKTIHLRPNVELRGYIRKDLFDKYYYNRR